MRQRAGSGVAIGGLLGVVVLVLGVLIVSGAEDLSGAVGTNGDDGTARTGPLTPDDPDRVPPAAAVAIQRLAVVADPDPPAGEQHGHTQIGPQEIVALSGADGAVFDDQWAAAVAAVPALDTVDEAEAAGYVWAAVQGAGVGVHYVRWDLIDRPFDPAAPSMLLFDQRGGDDGELAGFSYWVRSPSAPGGFAGPNDRWHQHHGVCVVNGFVDREGAATPDACAGVYLGGADLWMLHAWVVPGWENRWGPFTTMNPSLCPATANTPELARCPEVAEVGL